MVIVINFGSQFAHLIARRIRDLGVKAEIVSFDTPLAKIIAQHPAGIILSGGPDSVLRKGSPRLPKRIFELGIPVLGICYGHQLMASLLGGSVRPDNKREFGKESLTVLRKKDIFDGLSPRETVWFSHGDQVTKLPKNFVRTAGTRSCRIAGFANEAKKLFGIQFHPEVTHTVHGKKILSNFVFNICHTKKDWQIHTVKKTLIDSLTSTIQQDHVVVGISGGVDSLVAATLLHQAIGKRLHAVFVDTGLLRKNEVADVSKALRARKFAHLHVIDASKLFLSRLKGIADPEQKRKIIGHTFINVFEKTIATKLKRYPVGFLAQGTIYPDRIESAEPSKHASKIKSHHNLTLPKKFGFKIIEPLRDLYKDEVRKLGRALGLPKHLLWRHPFPGPGLAIRIIGEVNGERLNILREADAIYQEELGRTGEYEKIWQAFAVLLPLKTVGVMGDARTYEYIIALRAVDSVDGMSADWHPMPRTLLDTIARRVVREVRGVNRVLYDITQKPPATIEYE